MVHYLSSMVLPLLPFLQGVFSTSIPVHFVQDSQRTWVFSTNANRKPYFYEDDSGVLRGFTVDLVYGVCKLASKKCAFTVTPFSECVQTIDNHFYPGRGLMSGWFDACPGYDDTTVRKNALDFTVAYKKSFARFQVNPGNPKGFDPNNVSGATITHLNGAATDALCLKKLGKTGATIIVASGIKEAMELVQNGTADALFSPRTRIPGFDTLPEEVQCAETGTAIMVKKGSELPEWWNPAFALFVSSGEYKSLCGKSKERYGVPVSSCFDTAFINNTKCSP